MSDLPRSQPSGTAQQYIAAFDAGAFPPGAFHHRDHVRLAWSYLQCHTLLETLELFPAALQRFATAHDLPGLYHETITWAYIFVIHERLRDPALGGTVDQALSDGLPDEFDDFARDNPDLFEWPSPILAAHYVEDTLWSDRARDHFVWPDSPAGENP